MHFPSFKSSTLSATGPGFCPASALLCVLKKHNPLVLADLVRLSGADFTKSDPAIHTLSPTPTLPIPYSTGVASGWKLSSSLSGLQPRPMCHLGDGKSMTSRLLGAGEPEEPGDQPFLWAAALGRCCPVTRETPYGPGIHPNTAETTSLHPSLIAGHRKASPPHCQYQYHIPTAVEGRLS